MSDDQELAALRARRLQELQGMQVRRRDLGNGGKRKASVGVGQGVGGMNYFYMYLFVIIIYGCFFMFSASFYYCYLLVCCVLHCV